VGHAALVLHLASHAKVLGGVEQQHRKKRRLTGTVAAYETNFFTVANGEGNRLEDASSTNLNA